MTTKKRGPVKMNKAARAERDAALIKMYTRGVSAVKIAECFEMQEASVFAVLKRCNVPTAQARKRLGLDMSKHRDATANELVMNGFCRCPEKATEYLRRADYFQQNPHALKLNEIGITPQKLAAANQKLSQIHAYVTSGIPFYVFFTTRNAFMPLSFRELVRFVANPYTYLLTHKDCIVDAPGAIVGGREPHVVAIGGIPC